MAPQHLVSVVAFFVLLTPSLAQVDPVITRPTAIFTLPKPCPTITVTSQRPVGYCPFPIPPCIAPACLQLTSISAPCGCPTTVPTSTKYLPCTEKCKGGCGTYYSTILPSTRCSTRPITTTKTTTKTTTQSTITSRPTIPWMTVTKPTRTNTCHTITVTTGSACPKIASKCSYVPDCIYLSTATARCGCPGVVEKTSCRTTCAQGCLTEFITSTDRGCFTIGPVHPTPLTLTFTPEETA